MLLFYSIVTASPPGKGVSLFREMWLFLYAGGMPLGLFNSDLLTQVWWAGVIDSSLASPHVTELPLPEGKPV